MALPGVTVTRRDTPPARSAETDTGVWFVVGQAERGPVVPTEITSLDQFVSTYGARQSDSYLYDALDTYFHEGGARVVVSRVVGPAAAAATRNLLDGSAGIALVVTAEYVGTYGNNLTVEVTHPTGSTFQLIIRESGTIVETSPEFATTAEAVAWSPTSTTVNITQGASVLDPAILAASALSGGAHDHASITDTHWQTAVDKFARDLGPGQVSYPGRTTAAAHAQLLAHAEAKGRVAVLDAPDTPTVATLTALAAADRAVTGARSAGLFAPWAVVPGLTASTTRTVPYSAVAAGIMSRNDGLGLSPNVAAAGDAGQAQYLVALSQAGWSDTDRGTLNDAGVNVALAKYGGFRTYGFRTLANPTTDPNWTWLNNARFYMLVVAEGGAIAEQFEFDQIDGQGIKISEFKGALTGMLLPYFADGTLYGDSPAEAFNVDTSVNTDVTIAAGQLKAVLALKMSPPAERVQLEIVKVPITQAVA